MSLPEILQRALMQGYATGGIHVQEAAVCLVLALLVGTYILAVYRLINRNAFYNQNFNLSLLVITLVTAAIILTIQSNIVVSLGMVGALSIVRFRTAVKDPMDLAFLFWAISAGIICGAGFAVIAFLASAAITACVLLYQHLPPSAAPQILVVNAASPAAEEGILPVIQKNCRVYKVRARNVTRDHLDLAVEVAGAAGQLLVAELMEAEGVTSASLVTHDGEVTF